MDKMGVMESFASRADEPRSDILKFDNLVGGLRVMRRIEVALSELFECDKCR